MVSSNRTPGLSEQEATRQEPVLICGDRPDVTEPSNTAFPIPFYYLHSKSQGTPKFIIAPLNAQYCLV